MMGSASQPTENTVDYSPERCAWAYLSRAIEGPSRPLWALLNAGRDCTEIARGVKTRASWLGALGAQTESRHSWHRWEEDLHVVAQLDGRLITPDDEEYPRQRVEQAFHFAELGANAHIASASSDIAPPHALWARGGNLASLCAQSVAIVGTRAITRYGAQATESIAQGVAARHWTVFSGGAFGVDTAAHRAALAAGGTTVAITACGIDRCYPAANRALFDDIAAPSSGAIVSEYPPHTPPQRHRFLTRNRLVAALTSGTVVVEAAWRSGALNTINWAENFGAITMAVPGPITGVSSLGCHQLIKDGRAQLVTSAEDVRELLDEIGAVDASGQYELDFAPNTIQSLSRNELRVFDAVPTADSAGREAEDIASEAGLTIGLTVHVLLDLDRKGLVVRSATQWKRA